MIETKDPVDQSVEVDIPLDIFPDSECSGAIMVMFPLFNAVKCEILD